MLSALKRLKWQWNKIKIYEKILCQKRNWEVRQIARVAKSKSKEKKICDTNFCFYVSEKRDQNKSYFPYDSALYTWKKVGECISQNIL